MPEASPDQPLTERRRFLTGMSLAGAAALAPAGLTAAQALAPPASANAVPPPNMAAETLPPLEVCVIGSSAGDSVSAAMLGGGTALADAGGASACAAVRPAGARAAAPARLMPVRKRRRSVSGWSGLASGIHVSRDSRRGWRPVSRR